MKLPVIKDYTIDAVLESVRDGGRLELERRLRNMHAENPRLAEYIAGWVSELPSDLSSSDKKFCLMGPIILYELLKAQASADAISVQGLLNTISHFTVADNSC